MTSLEFRINRQPHSPSQHEIFWQQGNRYVIVPAGRRYGKTRGGAEHATEHQITRSHLGSCIESGFKALWVDTTQVNIDKYFAEYFDPVLRAWFGDSKEARKMWHWDSRKKILTMPRFGSTMHFGSAERPENLEGFGYHKMYLNEAGIILKGEKGYKLWHQTLAPMTMENTCQVFFIGTPKGLGLFRDFAERGNDPKKYPGWKTYHRTSYDNPLITQTRIDTICAGMPERFVRQEIYAEFMEDDEGIPVIPYNAVAEACERILPDDYTFRIVWGVDPSQSGDDDATLAKRQGNRILEPVKTRSGELDSEIGARWVKAEWDATPADQKPEYIWVDAAGVGDGWYTHMRSMGLPVIPINWGKAAVDNTKFQRMRDELWWKCKEWIEHASLNGDIQLRDELCKPLLDKNWLDGKGIIKVESKEDMKRRLGAEGKSPNRADALVITFASGADEKPRITNREYGYGKRRKSRNRWMAA